jgi:methyltransferase-like protein/2-polyprenyl-3-methyl-5-hydroxy-6-metoxy-1,4-benzoquinol methylase
VSDSGELRSGDAIVRAAYEAVPYPGASQQTTRPEHLAALAILCGIDPAPVESCRLLELGCGDGGNLIPMAVELPGSHFIGIDLSPRQIAIGEEFAGALGITNLELRTASILDVDESFGTFDYIVAHGVYSWVEPHVQAKMLEICRRNLAPHGVAYISYNTFPGWHQRALVREMLLYHTRNVGDPFEKVARSRELIAAMIDASAKSGDAHAQLLREAQAHLDEYADRPHYILHEYLEASNAPVTFHEFIARASAAGLQYLCDAEPQRTGIGALPDLTAARVQQFAGDDRIAREQYVDFVVNRTFRRSLLVHREQHVEEPAVTAARLQRLFITSSTTPESDAPRIDDDSSESFRTERGATFSSTHPLAKSVLVELARAWPCALTAAELCIITNAAEEDIAELLGALFASSVIELHAMRPHCVNRASDRPHATLLARMQAATSELVTNQHGRVLKLDEPIARLLLQQLDGTRDRAALIRLLDREVSAGRLDVSVDGHIPDVQRIPSVLQALLEHHLRKMIEYALLVE